MPRPVLPILLGLGGLSLACYDRSEGVRPLDMLYGTSASAQDRPASGPSSRPSSGPGSGPTTRPSSGPAGGPAGAGEPRPGSVPTDTEAKTGLPATEGLAEVLKAAVQGAMVDYRAVAERRGKLDAWLTAVAKAAPDKAEKRARLAFYINAYNAAVLARALDTVLGKGPEGGDLFGVLKVEGFFEDPAVVVGGEKLSLNALEGKARALGDPRVHFAVNCASVSCPPLRRVPWSAATLDLDLDAATRAYFAGPHGLVVEGDEVRTTRLLDWYAKDFEGVGGPTAFLLRFAPEAARAAIREHGITGYLDYDWALNRR